MKLSLANRLTASGALRTVALAALLALGTRWAVSQVYQPPPPPLTAAPCVPTKKDPCIDRNATPATPAAAETFPFPGENAAPGAAAAPAAASAPGSTPQPAFPFPGEPAPAGAAPVDAAPADASGTHPFPGEPADPASASSSSSSSSAPDPDASPEPTPSPDKTADKTALKDQGSSGSTRFQRRHLPRVEDKDNREEQDLQVSKYYASTGDYKAAYLRAKDAVASVPTDPEAHYQLADVARHFGKPDEARDEFAAYLRLDPEGEHTRSAQTALLQLSPK